MFLSHCVSIQLLQNVKWILATLRIDGGVQHLGT